MNWFSPQIRKDRTDRFLIAVCLSRRFDFIDENSCDFIVPLCKSDWGLIYSNAMDVEKEVALGRAPGSERRSGAGLGKSWQWNTPPA